MKKARTQHVTDDGEIEEVEDEERGRKAAGHNRGHREKAQVDKFFRTKRFTGCFSLASASFIWFLSSPTCAGLFGSHNPEERQHAIGRRTCHHLGGHYFSPRRQETMTSNSLL